MATSEAPAAPSHSVILPPPAARRPRDFGGSDVVEFEGEIPILDFGDYDDGEDYYMPVPKAEALEELSQQLTWASENVGFFFVRGGKTIEATVAQLPRLFDVAQRFHNSCPADALKQFVPNMLSIYRDSISGEGDPAELVAQKAEQAVQNLMTPSPSTNRVLTLSKGHGRRWRDNWFPGEEEVPGAFAATEAYVQAMEEITGRLLLPVYAHALGLEERELKATFQDPRHFLMLNHYRTPKTERDREERFGMSMHADNDFFTLLAQDRLPGLQIMLRDGQWAQVPCPEGCLLVNTGEFLTRMTNGKWLNTVHRVVQPPVGGQARHSVPCFVFPDKGSLVAPLPRFCTDDQGPPAFRPFSVREILLANETTPYNVGKREESTRRQGKL